jgi:hypothetical protein
MGEHPELKNLYNTVIENKYGWDRWGLLSVLSDCVLNYVKGNILEIGSGESSIYLSKLAEKYDRICYHVEYSKSGVANMKNTKGYFGENSVVYNGKSDDFFIDSSMSPLALAFIDGDHSYEVVSRDFWNINDHLVDDGFVFIHDTYPPDQSWTVDHKCGTVNQLRIDLESLDGWEVFTFPFTAFNVGLTMVRRKKDRKWEFKI